MLPIYVFSHGEVATAVFNGVAAFISTHDFASLLFIASFFSIIGATILYIQSHDLAHFGRWFGIYFTITSILLGFKTSVEIIDVTNPMAIHQVDHVPVGLAMPAYLVSNASYAVSQGLSDVFHIVDDQNYLKTGMLFGAKLFHTVTLGVGPDLKTKADLSNFTQQCIVPDILIVKKYTADELMSASDIFSFLATKTMSPIRGIYIDGEFKTCAVALPLIRSSVVNQVGLQVSWVSRLLYGNEPVNQAKVLQELTNSYTNLLGISQNAQNILIQNMAINAIRNGIKTNFAVVNSSSALLNYAQTNALQKQLVTDNTIARTAAYLLPLMQTVLFLVCIAIFPLIMLFAMQPFTFFSMLKSYVNALIYLGMWPILFVIINFVMTSALSNYMTGLAIDQGGITLSNQDPLLYSTEQFAGYAGYLIGLVPVFAGFLFYGLEKTVSGIATTMTSTLQSRASSSSEGLAEGNMSMGNVSLGNLSWNNWSANKHDLNATYFKGMNSQQLPSGAIVTTAADGTKIVDTSQAVSRLPVEMNSSKSLMESATKQASQHRSEAASLDQNMQSALSAGSQDLMNLTSSVSKSEQEGHHYSVNNTSSVVQAAHHAASIVRQYAERHGISEQKANEILFAASAGVDAGASLSTPVTKLGISGEASLNVQKRGSSISSEDYSDAKEFAISNGYTRDINLIKQVSHDDSYSYGSQEERNAVKGFSSHFEQTELYNQQKSFHLQEAHHFEQAASFIKQGGVGFTQNWNQEFVEYLANQSLSVGSGPMGIEHAALIITKAPQSVEKYAEHFMTIKMHQMEQRFNQSHEKIGIDAIGLIEKNKSGINQEMVIDRSTQNMFSAEYQATESRLESGHLSTKPVDKFVTQSGNNEFDIKDKVSNSSEMIGSVKNTIEERFSAGRKGALDLAKEAQPFNNNKA